MESRACGCLFQYVKINATIACNDVAKKIMRKSIVIAICIICLSFGAIAAIYLLNYFKIQQPLNEAIESDVRNHGIQASAYYENFIDTSVIVFKLNKLEEDKSIGDVYRTILQFIDNLNLKNLDDTKIIFEGNESRGDLVAQYRLQDIMEEVLSSDTRNDDVEVLVYYSDLINSKELIYDLRDFAGEKSQADLFRVFLQFADAIQDDNFESVFLSFDGNQRFMLHGDYYNRIGSEFDTQNPIYTIRTFPENVKNLDGSDAYPEWTGGILGVYKKQMEDFDDLNKKWYLNDWINTYNSAN
jgi:hypothetical protein